MEAGVHCKLLTCSSLSFLPITCPFCRTEFCESHFLPEQHDCKAPGGLTSPLSDIELAKRYARSSPSGLLGDRLPCQKKDCKKFSLEFNQDVASTSVRVIDGSGGSSFAHSAPRCERCRGIFCMAHRSAVAHVCKALPPPTEGQAKIQAAVERKAKAQAVLAKLYPNRKA